MSATKEKLILVVEDDRAIRETIQQALELEGFSVVTAEHGKEALEALTERNLRPSLILLDLMMPVMNGWEFLDALEALPAFQAPPVVITSAVREPSHHQRASAFLKKPIELDDLLNTITRHLDAAAGTTA
jgi:two-component system chemotaxis response regulator CheY